MQFEQVLDLPYIGHLIAENFSKCRKWIDEQPNSKDIYTCLHKLIGMGTTSANYFNENTYTKIHISDRSDSSRIRIVFNVPVRLEDEDRIICRRCRLVFAVENGSVEAGVYMSDKVFRPDPYDDVYIRIGSEEPETWECCGGTMKVSTVFSAITDYVMSEIEEQLGTDYQFDLDSSIELV